MEDQTQAASSPAPVETPVAEAPQSFEIPRSNTPEYQEWRKTGELPKPKTEAPAPSDKSEETTTDDAADSAATTQEKPSKRRPDVEARIKQITDKHASEMAQLRRELEEARRPKETKADPSPAKPAQPQTYKEWNETFNGLQWREQYAREHPDASFEDIMDAQSEFKAEVRDHFRAAEQARNDSMRRFNDSVTKAREIYQDFDAIADPMAGKVAELIQNPSLDKTLRNTLYDPEAAHILYALGKDPAIVEKFGELAFNDPAEAIHLWKSLKADALKAIGNGGNSEQANRNERGQFVKAEPPPTPAKRGPESAPEPPIEIGSRGTSTLTESERAFQSIERGDGKAFRQWKEAEDRREIARRRGA